MKVQFQFTAADLADVAERSAARLRTVRGARWRGTATFTALLALALFFLLDGGAVTRAIFSLLFCIAATGVWWALTRKSRNSTYLKYYESMGGDGPFLCEVELQASGVTTRQSGVETKRSWSSLENVVETEGDLEFVFRPSATLVVRSRAFATMTERAEFLRTAQAYMGWSAQLPPTTSP
jgi:hypothetical protein